LVLVLVIMGIVAAIAAPRYAAAVARYRADLAARRIATDLSSAQASAKSTSKSQSVVFNQAAGTYQMSGVKELDSSATAYLINLAADPYLVTIGTVNFGGSAQVTFDAFGLPSSAGSITVQGGGITKSVVVDAVTGKASVQ
jgi:type II secretory pathway pseudopilin PulG